MVDSCSDMCLDLLKLGGPLSEVLNAIFDSAYNGIVVIDRDGIVRVYNKKARSIFGDSDSRQVVGMHMAKLRPESWPDLQQVIKSGVPHIGKKIELAQATIIANRTPIYHDGQIFGVISVFQDISEYETIISQLQTFQELNRELAAIFESSYDGLYITDGNANTIRVNRAYERITGLDREGLIGRNMKDLVNEEVFDHSVTLEVLEKKRPITIMQKVMGDKQVIVTGTPIYDDSDGIALVVTNVRDITELNSLRLELEESKQINKRYFQFIQEHDGIEHALKEMVVKSQAMVRVVRLAAKAARSSISVLLLGESGVGKSMLAKIIHQMGPRKDKPFVKINCGTIPEALLESELFGYDKGAFTGALSAGKIGLIEAANEGTVFLDEIGELVPSLQVKLLEVIEDKAFVRVGATRRTRVDISIIAATSRNLKDLMEQGRFREDLYYRLNVIPIHIPPLRERTDDIGSLSFHVLDNFNRAKGLNKRFSPDVVGALKAYSYPGNVRELINIVERIIVMSEGDLIGMSDLPYEFKSPATSFQDVIGRGMDLKKSLEQVEASMIVNALKESRGLKNAAELLGIHASTLWRKMEKYNINGSN
ncbi:MAG: sigma 54-interacting transcriptional regulator [Deltaproteobacteria bacterium]|nr:sigma 54-interacting transcriptional regulator [Candidatus Anaeroferrophillus wilburensis]MBN2889020.1 sigma 54-interacting transcriptional regulator [Deltaproteobacteria bacterium]